MRRPLTGAAAAAGRRGRAEAGGGAAVVAQGALTRVHSHTRCGGGGTALLCRRCPHATLHPQRTSPQLVRQRPDASADGTLVAASIISSAFHVSASPSHASHSHPRRRRRSRCHRHHVAAVWPPCRSQSSTCRTAAPCRVTGVQHIAGHRSRAQSSSPRLRGRVKNQSRSSDRSPA
jgi:hypothetical protein